MPQMPADHANRFEDETPDEFEADETPTPIPQTPARGRNTRPAPPHQAAAVPVPSYLRDLAAMPGVDADAFDGVPTGTAWVKIESANGASRAMPLAHLAPDALDTLAEFGFEGHTTFEVREGQAGRVLRYFACRLDQLEPEPVDPNAAPGAAGLAGDSRMVELLTRQQMQINALEQRLAAGTADPLAGLEKAFGMFDRFSKMLQRAMPAMPAPQNGIGQILDVAAQVIPMFQKQAEQAAEPNPEEPNGP